MLSVYRVYLENEKAIYGLFTAMCLHSAIGSSAHVKHMSPVRVQTVNTLVIHTTTYAFIISTFNLTCFDTIVSSSGQYL